MPRKIIKRFTPNPETIKQQKALKIFGSLLTNPNLWCLNRRSAAGAFAVGLFMAWVPLPSQMIMASGLTILFRVNVPLATALVWISNPVTMPPFFYFAYKLGSHLMGLPPQPFHFELSWDFFTEPNGVYRPPFPIGMFSVCHYQLVSRLLCHQRYMALFGCKRLEKTPTAYHVNNWI